MGEDVLKKPVHVAIVRESHVAKLRREGRFPDSPFGLNTTAQTTLPATKASVSPSLHSLAALSTLASGTQVRKRAMVRARLRVLYDHVPPLENSPPCSTCVASPCCVAFLIHLTPDEFKSGFLGEYAVEVTPEIQKQLQSTSSPISSYALRQKDPVESGEDTFLLEGLPGTPCPMLGADGACTIYEDRPLVCRTYSCVEDERITDAMRAGEE